MEKKQLNEMKFMMERLESPRMTNTEYEKKRMLKEDYEGSQELKPSLNRLEEIVKSGKVDDMSVAIGHIYKALKAIEHNLDQAWRNHYYKYQ